LYLAARPFRVAASRSCRDRARGEQMLADHEARNAYRPLGLLARIDIT